MKVSELTGEQLDAWVAKAEGAPGPGWYQERSGVWARRGDHVIFRPSLFWEIGGPIIERERIAVWFDMNGWHAMMPDDGCYLPDVGILDVRGGDGHAGPTPLIAAMHAYVASRLGEVVGDA